MDAASADQENKGHSVTLLSSLHFAWLEQWEGSPCYFMLLLCQEWSCKILSLKSNELGVLQNGGIHMVKGHVPGP